MKSKYWRTPSKETQELVEAERKRGYTPMPPEICSAIRRFVRDEFGLNRFTMLYVDNGATRNYPAYGVVRLKGSKEVNASDHFDLYWRFLKNSKDIDEEE